MEYGCNTPFLFHKMYYEKKFNNNNCNSFLTLFGVVMVASSSSIWAAYKFNNPNKYMIHQLIFCKYRFCFNVYM